MKRSIILLLLVLIVYTNSQCESGFTRLNQNCVPVNYIDGCHLYANNGQCSICEYGYVKNCEICQLSPKNRPEQCCVQRNQFSTCTKCAPGLFLQNSRCIRNIIDKCVVKINGQCQTCGKGFYVNQNKKKCLPIINGCQQYLPNGLCNKCSSSILRESSIDYRYQLINGICVGRKITVYEPKDSTRCRLRNSYGCINCENNYYLSQTRQCIAYQQGCLIYLRGKCQQCSVHRGYVYNQLSGKCIKKNNGILIPNCIQYLDQSQIQSLRCISCRAGYRIISNDCVDQKTIGYKVKKQCAKGFTLTIDNKCKQTSTNLIKRQQQKPVGPLIKQPGCIYQYGKCQFCDKPFIKLQGTCTIPNCRQISKKSSRNTIQSYQCTQCRYPYELNTLGNCQITKCTKYQQFSNKCVLCQIGYHLRSGQKCILNDINCQIYNNDGVCQKCIDKYFVSSSGQCMLKQSNCDQQQNRVNGLAVCTSCVDGFFLNKNFQCQKVDINCRVYVNGLCKTCQSRYFLYDDICFPFTIGCVRYHGKSCTQCKKGYSMFNAECYSLKGLGMKLQGQDDKYNFDIYPLDITKSKYYIENLSPASQICDVIYSSKYSNQFTNPLLSFEDKQYKNQKKRSNGWKAQNNQKGQYIGYKIRQNEDSVTFYALQLQFIQQSSIKSFYLQYSKDGINWIRVENRFFVNKYLNSDSPDYMKQNNIITVYFTGIYARAIRIVIDEFVSWPACKIEFFYYDLLRYKKIMNLKSLRYLRQAIQTNFVDRVDNQLYINQKYFFDPQFQCSKSAEIACFTGLQLCELRSISSIELVNQIQTNQIISYVSEFYLTTSFNGRKFTCYKQCKKYQVTEKDIKISSNGKYYTYKLTLPDLQAKNLRVYPTKWVGTPKLTIVYDYE